MQANWSTTQSAVSMESILELQKKVQTQIENKFIGDLSKPMAIHGLGVKWLEPPCEPRMEAMAFRVFNDYAIHAWKIPNRVLALGCGDIGWRDTPKPKNKWLRVAALVAAVIFFVAIW